MSNRNAFISLLFGLLAVMASACNTPPNSSSEVTNPIIKVDGSSTVYPISAAIATKFQSSNPNITLEVKFSGTGGGFKKFCLGDIDISNASRPIRPEEKEACKAAGISFYELPIAYDALAVVVNPKNTWAANITVAELKKLWEPRAEGRIMRWNQIRPNYPNQPITLFAPGQDSGTFDYFTEAINGTAKAARKDVNDSENDDVLAQGVMSDPNSIAYFGFAYYEKNAQTLKPLAIDSGKGAVMPSRETVEKAKYQPLARPLFIYVSARAMQKPEVKNFVEFYLKNAAQTVTEVGYIPLPQKGYALGQNRLNLGRVGTVFSGKAAFNLTISQLLGKTEF